jgi:predicted HTH domain antitoxin
MILEISDDIIRRAKISEIEIKTDFALFLYNKRFLTLEQASKFSGLDIYEFQKLLGANKIPVNYDISDLKDDLETIQKFK